MAFVCGTEGFNPPLVREGLQQIIDREVKNITGYDRPAVSEMTEPEAEFLICLTRMAKPKKVLELGVSAGGTTKMLLDELAPDASLYSVDLLKHYYRDKTKPVGYIARDMYQPKKHAKWQLFPGKDISECIAEIGGDIDMLVLDTVHALPGEFLSFLTVLPYMKDNSLLVLHDISLFALRQRTMDTTARPAHYCNELLFSAIASRTKLLPPGEMSNIGAMILERDLVMRHIQSVFYMLLLPWRYTPEKKLLDRTGEFVKKNYSPEMAQIYGAALQWHEIALEKEKKNGTKRAASAGEASPNAIELLQEKPFTIEVEATNKKTLTVSGTVVYDPRSDYKGSLLYLTLDGEHKELKGLVYSTWLHVYYTYLTSPDDRNFRFVFDIPDGVKKIGVHFLNISGRRCSLAEKPEITLS